jgi:two-component system sensor histidine kinase BaeS
MDKNADRFSLRSIVVDKQPVGWLGIVKRKHMIDPFFMDFIKGQSLTFYTIGGAILLLAAFVSMVLSKHLLKPIRQLTQGTRALTTFRFDTRIPVRSQDELGQLAQDFNRMADTLSEYETMRKQWISDISHELRTPLAILKGEIEALQDGVREVSPDTLESLSSEVLRLNKLVADLHTLSLADTQNLQAVKTDVRPLEILKLMASHYQNRMESRGIDLRVDLDQMGAPTVQGDPDRMAQLFANLLENSLRYTDSPGIVNISGRQDSQQLTIRFEDSAPGVPQPSLNRIFERLYRVDSSRNRRLGGSGLGLAICKQIVAHHDGTIRADKAAAGGLCIQIDLPLKDADGLPPKEPL